MASGFGSLDAAFCSQVEGKTYLWGGFNKILLEGKAEFAAPVYTFDPYLETWAKLTSCGSPPSGVHSGACACAGHHMYTYGGRDSGLDGSLHCLDTRTLTWTKLANSTTGPMRKQNCGMIVHGNRLLLFGGYGLLSGPIQPGSEFAVDMKHADDSGWTNELHMFDLKEGEV